jgi:hypothetical protein
MGRLNQVIRFRMVPPQPLGLLLFRFGRSVAMDVRWKYRQQLASRPYSAVYAEYTPFSRRTGILALCAAVYLNRGLQTIATPHLFK